MKQILINIHTECNRRLFSGYLFLEFIFGCAKPLRKTTKGVGFELKLRPSNRKQDVLYTTLGNNTVNVTNNSVYFYIPTIIASSKTQRIFEEGVTKNFTLLYES